MSKLFFFRLAPSVLALPRGVKRFVAVLVDMALCVLSVWLAFFLRLGEFVVLSESALPAVIASIGIALPIFVISGFYRAIFRYSGWPALLAVARAVSLYGLLYASIVTAIGIPQVPRTIGIIQPLLLLFLVGGSRVLVRAWLGNQYLSILKNNSRPRVLIYGAGRAGRQLVAAMSSSTEMKVIGFLDDDDRLHGHALNGLPIYNPTDLENLGKTLSIQMVMLALPSISRKRRNDILNNIRRTNILVRTLPSLSDLAHGRVSISDVRELDIDDLLGREPVPPNHILLAKNIHKKIVMVTGAGGSIGSELCRQILLNGATKLLLVEQSEFALYSIHKELEEKRASSETILVPLLASVQDQDRIYEILSTWCPDTVYHAAAYKHVTLVEQNLAAGIKNNVLGTLYTALASAENSVTDFVLISTDKAVRPTSVMGASKRLAEMALQAVACNLKNSNTKFSMVRFGNVLDSSGSVVPKFRQQIKEGGQITITHPDVTRYFMTIPEAAQLVIQAGAMAKGGADVFVLDMGQPVRIIDLAHQMVALSGLTIKNEQNLDGDIEIKITGLQHGEKLYEELLIGNNPQSTLHPRILRAEEGFVPWEEFEIKLKSLELALDMNDVATILLMMKELVAEYVPSNAIVDWIYLEQESELQQINLAFKPS